MRRVKRQTDEERARDELFLALYMSHKSHAQISAATGLGKAAVEQRIHRKGLRQLRNKLERESAPKITHEQRSEIVKSCLAADLQTTCEALGDVKRSRDPETMKLRADLVSVVASTAGRVFAWDSGHVQNNVYNFALVNATREVEPPAIDVQSQPVQ